MQVPNPVVGRTSNDGTPLQAPQVSVPAGAFGGQIGNAIKGLGDNIVDYGVKGLELARTRDESTTKFQTLQSFDTFTSDVDNTMQELKRTADPTGKGYVKTSMDVFQQKADAYVKSVPPALQPEYQYKVNNLRTTLLGQSTDFQYKAGDLYFQQGISDKLDAAKKAVYAAPDQLEAQRLAVQQTIATSDLPTIAKQDLYRKANEALEGTAYRQAYVQQKLDIANGVNQPRTYGPRSQIVADGQRVDNLTPGAKGILDGIAASGAVPQIIVSSGTREVGENALRGGVQHSQHIPNAEGLGNAIDINTAKMSDVEKAAVLRAAIESGAKGIGIYASGDHFHFDARDTPVVWGQKGTSAEKIEDQPAWARPALAALFSGQTPQRNPTNTGSSDDMSAYLQSLGGKEADGNIYAKNPKSSAYGLYQVTSGTWDDIAKAHPELGLTDRSDPHQQELAIRAFTKDNDKILSDNGLDITNKNRYMMHFLGRQGGVDFLKAYQANPDQIPGPEFSKAAAANHSVFYKVVPGGIHGTGLVPRTMGEIYALQTQRFAGGIDRQQSALDNNPAFAHVPLEDRLAMQKDGDAEVQKQLLQRQQDLAKQQASVMNSLYNGVLDGTMGRADVDAAYKAGQLTDAANREQLYTAITKRDAEQNLQAGGLAAIAAGQPQDLNSETWKKQYNAAVAGKDQQARVAAGDREFITDGLVPAAQRVQDIPTDIAGQLAALTRGADRGLNKYAYDAMSMLAQVAPDAFNKRFDDQTRSMSRAYDTAVRDGNVDEFLNRMNGPGAEEWRRQLPQMQEEAKQYLDGKTLNKQVPNSETIFNKIIGSFSSSIPVFGATATAPAYPLAQMAMQKDFRDEFTQEYTIYRDPVKASDAAIKKLEGRWGATPLGGQLTVMKDPPEKVGYQPFQTGPGATADYSWIDRQARSELNIPPGQKYELISDDQTAREKEAFRQGQGTPPSYQIVTYDANGVPTIIPATNGAGNRRIYFQVPQAEKDESVRALQERGAARDALQKIGLADELARSSVISGIPVPPDVKAEADAAAATLKSLAPPQQKADDRWWEDRRAAIKAYSKVQDDVIAFRQNHAYMTPLPSELGKQKAALEEVLYGQHWGQADSSVFQHGDVQPPPEPGEPQPSYVDQQAAGNAPTPVPLIHPRDPRHWVARGLLPLPEIK